MSETDKWSAKDLAEAVKAFLNTHGKEATITDTTVECGEFKFECRYYSLQGLDMVVWLGDEYWLINRAPFSPVALDFVNGNYKDNRHVFSHGKRCGVQSCTNQ